MNGTPNANRSALRPLCLARTALAVLGMASLLAAPLVSAAYEIGRVSNGGTIDGHVALSGEVAPEKTVKVTKNQVYCGTSVADPTYTVDSAGGLGNVIVYLKDITKGKAPDTDVSSLLAENCMMI